MSQSTHTTHAVDVRDQVAVTRDAYETLVHEFRALKRMVRDVDLPSDFASLYDRIDAYLPDDLGDVGGGQTFGAWLDEVDGAIDRVEEKSDINTHTDPIIGDPCERCGGATSENDVAEVGAGGQEFETMLVHASCMNDGEETA